MIFFIELKDAPVTGLVDELDNPEATTEELSNKNGDFTPDGGDRPIPIDETSLPQSPVLPLIKSKYRK